jgi:UPF0716 protein FxsA
MRGSFAARLALVTLFVGVPILEIYVIIQVGQAIGAWPTVLLLILESVIGAMILRHEGARAWRALVEALHAHRMPARELADAAVVLIGGLLLITPGFVTDAFGFFCVLPPTRPLARRILAYVVSRRLTIVGPGGTVTPGTAPRRGGVHRIYGRSEDDTRP